MIPARLKSLLSTQQAALYAVIAGMFGFIFSNVGMVGSPLLIPLIFFSALPSFLIGLSLGTSFMAITCSVQVLMHGVFSYLGLFDGKLYVAAFSQIVSWLFIAQLLKPEEKTNNHFLSVVLTLLGIGAFVLSAAVGYFEIFQQGLEQAVNHFINSLLVGVRLSDQSSELQAFQNNLEAIKQLLPGIIVLATLCLWGLNAQFAQRLLQKKNWNIRKDVAFETLQLPTWYSFVFSGTLLLGLVPLGLISYFAKNMTVILLLPYIVLGLGVIHAFAKNNKHQKAILFGFYCLTFIFLWVQAIIVLLGVTEHIIGLKRRFIYKSNHH